MEGKTRSVVDNASLMKVLEEKIIRRQVTTRDKSPKEDMTIVTRSVNIERRRGTFK